MKMETVEHFAKIALVTHLLGQAQPLGEKEVEKLNEVRHRYQVLQAPSRRPSATADLESDDEPRETASSRGLARSAWPFYSPPIRKRNPARKLIGSAGYPTTSL